MCYQSELGVHKKKFEELRATLLAALSGDGPRILLLTGPSGCGKTAAVKVLTEELG